MRHLLKKICLTTVVSLIALPINAAEINLTISHFLSPKAPPHTKFIAPWAAKIEKESNGRIKFQIFPAMSLGGKPPHLYSQVRDGTADIAWTLIGYTAGVFPRAEVFELPSVHQNSAYATTMAIQDNFKLIAQDFKDVKPILIHAHGGNALHLTKGCVDNVSGLKGLKLRTPSRSGGWYISQLGAEPVGMPVPALPQALSKGTVQGALLPFEIFPPYKIHELTKCSITGTNNTRFGTSVFMFAMNKDSYNKLPADLKKIIDNNSGKAIAADAGRLWDAIELPGQKMQKATGSPVKVFSPNATKEMYRIGEKVAEKWVKNASSEGVRNPKKILKAARKSVKKYTK